METFCYQQQRIKKKNDFKGSQTGNNGLELIFDETEQHCVNVLKKLTKFSELMWLSVLLPSWICFILFIICGFPNPETVYRQFKLK